MITRRCFLGNSLASAVTLAGFPALSSPHTDQVGAKLVLIQLRGGMDALTAVPPIGDKRLQSIRPTTWVRNTFALNSDFGLHPALITLSDLWKKNQLSIIHATGFPYTGKSHFDGQNLMEGGGNRPYELDTGWLGRAMNIAGLKGLALSLPIPLVLRGIEGNDNYFPSIVQRIPSPSTYRALMNVWDNDPKVLNALEQIVARPEQKLMAPGSTRKEREQIRDNQVLAKQAAEQLRKPHGPRVALFDFAGFDTHAGQGAADGIHADKLTELDNIIRILHKELGEVWNETLVVTSTEFGRNVRENGSSGTDHGWASCQFLAGGLVRKAQVYSDWPGLKRAQLFEGTDLKSTIDARAVFATAISRSFGIDHAQIKSAIFAGAEIPDFTAKLVRG